MSKKARKGASARTKSSAQREAVRQAGLQEAERLLRRKRPQEALAVLQQQEQLYPNDEELLALLVNTCLDLNDLQGYQRYAERLLPMRANDPDLLLALAGTYAANLYPSLAVQTFRRFLQRYPDDPKSRDARQSLVRLETAPPALCPRPVCCPAARCVRGCGANGKIPSIINSTSLGNH